MNKTRRNYKIPTGIKTPILEEEMFDDNDLPKTPIHDIILLPKIPSHKIYLLPNAPVTSSNEKKQIIGNMKLKRIQLFDDYLLLLTNIIKENKCNNASSIREIIKMKNKIDDIDNEIEKKSPIHKKGGKRTRRNKKMKN
jgi:hypothetical protein